MVVIVFVVVLFYLFLLMVSHCSMNLLMGNMTDKWAYTSYSVSQHIYWYSVRLSSLHPFNKIRMIFQLNSTDSTHQAQHNKQFSPFFPNKTPIPLSSAYSTRPAQLTTYAT